MPDTAQSSTGQPRKVTLVPGPSPSSGGNGQKPQLYKKREKIYPKLAHGRFRTVKWVLMIIAMIVYYGLPWVRWPRSGDIPDQAVLADFQGERFYFFFLEIWPQEVHYITGVLILAALGLFLVTSLFGRVWCGYACPQTVWTDIFLVVERFFEGDRAARRRLDVQPNTFNKIARKTAKHVVWLVISFFTGGALIMYIHDAPTLVSEFWVGRAPVAVYVMAALLTFTTYSLAGIMREQLCTYMCPWPRIQAALTDADALNVTYRYDRGEPRGPMHKEDDWSQRGDCIDCKQCVQVCPMGIDIRDGDQLECIHCALCIDACDEIMDRIGRPRGLIGYDTREAVEERAAGGTPKYRLIRPRTVLYGVLFFAVAGLMVFGLATRSTFEVNVLKDRSPPYVQLADGGVRNGYELKIINKAATARDLTVSVSGPEGLEVEIIGLPAFDGTQTTLPIEPSGVDRFRFLVTAPDGLAERRTTLELTLSDPARNERQTNRVAFVGPEATG
jgi:cytochrome c oxidase accessory protein FixG